LAEEQMVVAMDSSDPAAVEAVLAEYQDAIEAGVERRRLLAQQLIDAAKSRALLNNVDTRTYDASRSMPTISFLIHQPSPMGELAAIVRGLPAAAWRSLEHAGYSRDEISAVVGNSPKTIRRKERRDEPLDVAEGDRTMRLMRITVEAAEAFGDQSKALAWMRRPNAALLGKTPLETITT
jgi:putative toxin-antitoxin system antitoxin component (TIGR02293 family)